MAGEEITMTIGWNEDFTTFDVGHFQPAGTTAAWSEAANMLMAGGCEAQSFALLSSFAAPLMALFPTKEGGAVVSIHGGRRSGKSVAMAAAGSVWGLPSMLALGNGGLARVAELRHLPVLATTLAHRDPYVASEFISAFLGPRDHRTMMLCIGGVSLRESIVPAMGGCVTEFPVYVPRGLIAPDKSSPSVLERKLLDNRGNAGVAYLHALCQPEVVPWAKKMLASKYGVMVDELGLGLEWRFQMRAIAAVWIAGEICVRAGILEVSPERIARWAMDKCLPKKKEAAE